VSLTDPAAPAVAPVHTLAHYRKLVIQLAAVAAAVLLVFVDATTDGGPVTGVTWWIAVGAAVQAFATWWPAVWWSKFLASAVGVVFSAVAAGLTGGWTTAEVLAVFWQLMMWAASGAVDNAPRPVPPAPNPFPRTVDAGYVRAGAAVRVLLLAVLLGAAATVVAPMLHARATPPAHRAGPCWPALARQTPISAGNAMAVTHARPRRG
jgi:hypothetical protein